MLGSLVCRAEAFCEPWFEDWARRLGMDDPSKPFEQRNVHRKVWEWVCIVQALHERGCLREGAKALGFAVGRERLPALFASFGVNVLASDSGDPGVAEKWSKTREYTGALDGLYYPQFLPREAFDQRVRYQHLDMRDLSGLERGAYDFVWSACALEHLGSLEAGADYIVAATRLLRPGGVAVHTTEFNISSLDQTRDNADTVFYRRMDLEQLGARLRSEGAGLAPLDLEPGLHEYDLKFDARPFYEGGRKHLKLSLGGFIVTSVMLIVQN